MSACATNNCTDRALDAQMPRTKRRGTVTGAVPLKHLAVLAVILGLAGFAALAIWVNWLTVTLGVIGFIDYVVLYGWTKRTTPYSTLVGTISGAVPLVAGYTAVTNRFDGTALLLGLIMVFWQMPHFYAIGIFRKVDYALAKLPIWPVVRGVRSTQRWMLTYISLFIAAVLALVFHADTGTTFAIVVTAMGLYWLLLGLKGFRSLEAAKWARGVFGYSLVTLLILSASLAASPLLP